MKKTLIIASFLLLIFWVDSKNVFACTCVDIPAPLEEEVGFAFKSSTAIFSGEVISINPNSNKQLSLIVRFKTEKSWKGKFAKQLTVTTASNGAACGYTFEVGKKYVVYAYGEREKLEAGICTRTALLKDNEDIVFLNKLKKKN